ncbi:hypothetical protein CFBP7900_00360 [Xanthomonas hortorum pv. carotae]|uniref:Uncharacterized protein n=1 Tax=Xanthomonas hortorum pv. carotae TaxID=487904 RepID=A0A6V7BFS1_9XANT|nr:hypothetical protein XHC_4426 [Xanthomonas hortorum pv. carotae str. M081]CAD0300271.1 hypothetical protein CFBP7900_00360 [Xanthomonas hortorum pv. carotae]CAD0300289.1 hypothetical protein CFBP7900_00360 [Xanthomonas hortorum pv. carotae]
MHQSALPRDCPRHGDGRRRARQCGTWRSDRVASGRDDRNQCASEYGVCGPGVFYGYVDPETMTNSEFGADLHQAVSEITARPAGW